MGLIKCDKCNDWHYPDEPWMIHKVLQSKTQPNRFRAITDIGNNILAGDGWITCTAAFENYNLYDVATGETKPFGKVKGE